MSGPERMNGTGYTIGYKRPPEHTRFQPGQSGNPSGRPRGAQNFKTLFQKIMKEQISLREGSVTKKISKAEAILRGLAISAMKGDSRSQMTLFRLAEQVGQFEEKPEQLKTIERVIVSWMPREESPASTREGNVPTISQVSRD